MLYVNKEEMFISNIAIIKICFLAFTAPKIPPLATSDNLIHYTNDMLGKKRFLVLSFRTPCKEEEKIRTYIRQQI